MSDLLAAYEARIGFTGTIAPTLELLHELQLRHLNTIAFESLPSFMGLPVPVDPDSVRAKLLGSRRGGYCHEQNLLFHDVLAEIGFRVTALGGRVVWVRPDGKAPLTHRLTLVELPEGPFLADVGFGGQTPTAPLRLEPGLEQPTPHGVYRIMRDGPDHALELKLLTRWAPLYRFRLDPQHAIDFEMANWYTATFPRGRFTQNLICARVDGARRLTLANRTLSVRDASGPGVPHEIASAAELGDVLDRMFDLECPVPLDALWTRLAAVNTGLIVAVD